MFTKQLSAAVAFASVMVGMYIPQAMAATTSTSTKNIELNGQSVSKPAGLVHDGTTYMPIYYLNQVLNKLGFTLATKWDGKTWALQTPGYMQPDMADISVGSGNVTITLNGTPIQKVNSIVAVDPASGVQTTYLPIWYLERVLSRLGVTDDWNGTVWNLKTNLNYVGKSYDSIVQYVDTVWSNLDVNSNPDAIDNTLFHEGYVTSNFVTTDQQYNANHPWSTFVQQNSISKMELTLFHVNDNETQATSTRVNIMTSEVDTIFYTNGDEQYMSADNAWALLPSSTQGMWQVDSVQNLDQQSTSSGSGSSGISTRTGNTTNATSGSTTGSGSTGSGTSTNTSRTP